MYLMFFLIIEGLQRRPIYLIQRRLTYLVFALI